MRTIPLSSALTGGMVWWGVGGDVWHSPHFRELKLNGNTLSWTSPKKTSNQSTIDVSDIKASTSRDVCFINRSPLSLPCGVLFANTSHVCAHIWRNRALHHNTQEIRIGQNTPVFKKNKKARLC
jgi:hypothetical protein